MASIVVPATFSAAEDADVLYKASKGFGTDESAIIKIIGHRNAAQRKQIKKAYEDLHKEDLGKRLESELTGSLEKAIYRWMLDPADRDAVLANVAIRNEGSDYNVIIELACIHTPDDLLAVKRAYQARYKHSLEEDVAANTPGDLRQLLTGLVSVYRYNGDEINPSVAKSEADSFLKAIKKKDYNHEEVLRIVTTRSKAQVIGTLNQHIAEITKHLEEHKGDEYLKALRTAIECITDPKKYYVKVMIEALKGLGTDDDAVTRVFVTRAEKDLKEIEELYHKTTSVTLEKAVAKETSRHYEEFLLTLLGKEI